MKSYKEKIRRFCTVLLALMLCITFMPAGAFADDEGSLQDDITVEEQSLETAVEAEEPAAEPDMDTEETTDCIHSLELVPSREADCTNPGNIEYYLCTKCGKKFLNADSQQEVLDDEIQIPVDPDNHDWDDGVITRRPTADMPGEIVYTCKNCGKEELLEIPFDEDKAKELTLNGVKLKFKEAVVTTPDTALKNSVPGRVWVKGLKKSMKVSWENGSNLNPVDGVIILRATGKSTVFKEVAKVPFRTYPNGVESFKAKSTYTDKTASKKNTKYNYRVISYLSLDDNIYISKISKVDWAAGQISTSKLKNVYTGTMNKKSAKLQSKETTTLKLTVKSPKTKFMPNDRRWSSGNKNVATVSSKGKVTAKAPGTATISCRLASGAVVTSKITVVGAFKPAAPKLEVDYATTSSIHLKWNKVKNATSYDIYKSNDGLHWAKTPKNTTKTTYAFTDLKKDHRYTFYVIARNDRNGVDKNGNAKKYTALSNNSNVLNQKAVVKRRPMTLTGWPTSAKPKSGTTYEKTIKINPPLARKASLQMKSGKKWVNKKTIKLPKGTSQKSVKITFPNTWWSETTEWRLVVPATVTTDGFTTETLKIKSQRNYQNPSSYVQIKDTISKHGYSHYVSPVLVNGASTKSNHIEALIKTARKYLGDKYVQSRSGAPGKGIDESGLVIQACYGAGVDLWPISPSTRPYNCVPKIMSSKLRKIPYKGLVPGTTNNYDGVDRGDLIFFAKSKNDTPISVAIYTGLGGIIFADVNSGKVHTSTIAAVEKDYKYVVVGVRRIFN